MAVKIQKQTEANQLLKLVSVHDDAIDWQNSYVDDGELLDAEKKLLHIRRHDTQKLAFKDGETPTLFVFEHPSRVDVARKIRGLYTRQMTGSVTGNQETLDLWTEIWDKAFMGTQEGLDGGAMDHPPRRDGRMTDGFFQALEDSNVFSEMAMAFLFVVNAPKKASETAVVQAKK